MKSEAINFLKRVRIGVYYIDDAWVTNLFKEMLDIFKNDKILRMSNGRDSKWIEFENGDYIKFVKICDSSRGNKFDKVILQPGIPKNIYDTIIRPTIISRTNSIVIEDDEIIEAKAYYCYMKEVEEKNVEFIRTKQNCEYT